MGIRTFLPNGPKLPRWDKCISTFGTKKQIWPRPTLGNCRKSKNGTNTGWLSSQNWVFCHVDFARLAQMESFRHFSFSAWPILRKLGLVGVHIAKFSQKVGPKVLWCAPLTWTVAITQSRLESESAFDRIWIAFSTRKWFAFSQSSRHKMLWQSSKHTKMLKKCRAQLLRFSVNSRFVWLVFDVREDSWAGCQGVWLDSSFFTARSLLLGCQAVRLATGFSLEPGVVVGV